MMLFLHLDFFFNDTATTEIYTLSLLDALPISAVHGRDEMADQLQRRRRLEQHRRLRSEEHTSELQSPCNIVCRVLLEKKEAYASLHTDQERDYFMQLYHDVITSFGGTTSHDAD